MVAVTEAMSESQFIESLKIRKIQSFQGTIDDSGEYLDSIYQSNRSLAESIASDYRDRFLVELIQNAYDAHSVGTLDGEIKITLDECLGEFGTLLVANKGCPFDEDNVKSLCNIGLSQKPLDVSIGNKGLGFRSVIQITNSPRIYSQRSTAVDTNQFSGFCFGFAEAQDYENLFDDAKHRELAARDLPMFHIPINIESQSDVICKHAKNGFATVIEMPLRDAGAQESVRREFNHLQEQKVPILLFLNRVASLTVQIIDKSGRVETEFDFTRTESIIESKIIELSRICLGKAGQFLVARRPVSESAMKKAINKGISSGELNEYWSKWSGDGEVSVAVRLDSSIESPRLYTFLPMGENAVAPFSGYLHGSFSPSANRESLKGRIQLNALILKKAAILAARAIHYITNNVDGKIEEQLTAAECAASVVDLLCWTDSTSLETDEGIATKFVKKLTRTFGVSCFDSIPVIPCLSPSATSRQYIWQPPAPVRRWPTKTSTFAANAVVDDVAEINIWPIWDGIGDRIESLDEFVRKHSDGYEGGPSGEERAKLASLVAKKLVANRRTPMYKWKKFYNDLPDFMDDNGSCLAGLPILLCDDGKLHKAMSADESDSSDRPRSRQRKLKVTTAVFSPPDPSRNSRDDSFEVKPPKSLAKQFAFLHSKYPWHKELIDARKYLENHKLVGEFDRETVLSNLSRILEKENKKTVLRGGLRWAFQIWRQPRDFGRPIQIQPQHRFNVPTECGNYVPASEAVFSAEWPEETAGKLLQEFLDEAPKGLPDIERIARKRLAKPDDLAFRGKHIVDWVAFLSELGVKRGLIPELKSIKRKGFYSYEIRNLSILEHCDIPLEYKDFWAADIMKQGSTLLEFAYSRSYEIDGLIAWLPGQADFDRFTNACKKRYAKLILLLLSEKSDIRWSVTIRHQTYHQSEYKIWSTPLKSFLRSARWISVQDPASPNHDSIEACPCELWVNTNDRVQFETFLRRPIRELRDYFNRGSNELVKNLKDNCDLHIIDDPSTLSQQIEFLSEQFLSAGFSKHFEPHLINIYDRTWELLTKHVGESNYKANSISPPSKMLIRKDRQFEMMSMLDQDDDGDESLYVCDTNQEGDASLIAASGRPYFHLRNRDFDGEKIGILFQEFFGERVKRVSEANHKLLADDISIESCNGTPVLEVCPRLRAMVATAMEALSGTEAQRLPAGREKLLTKLDPLTLIKADRLRFLVDDLDVSINQKEDQAFHFKFGNNRSVIALQCSSESSEEWTWSLIDICIPAICEALNGLRALAPHLRLLATELKHNGDSLQRSSAWTDDVRKFSSILQLSPSASQAANASLSAGMKRHENWIRATVHYLLGDDGVTEFDKVKRDAFENCEFEDVLSRLLRDRFESVEMIIDSCRSSHSVGEFRENMGFQFKDFNTSLMALDLEPETYPDDHKLYIENFVRYNEVKIIDCLRTLSAKTLLDMRPAWDYAIQREQIRNIEPDSAWLTVYEKPPEDLLTESVNVWLSEQRAPLIDRHDEKLEPLQQVRDNNQNLVDKFVREATPVIQAWCNKHQRPESQMVRKDVEDCIQWLHCELDKAGIFDYQALNEATLIKWLNVLELEIWPLGMKTSIDLHVLGLSQVDLDAVTDDVHRKKEKQRREARLISFNGEAIDPIDADLFLLSERLKNGLSPKVLQRSLGSSPNVSRNGRKLGRSSEGSSAPRGVPRMPPEKAELVGKLGELAVYHWLQNRLPLQDIDAAWKSENGLTITSRKGDDTLGYDFQVSYRNQTWQIEVKASLNDPQSFAMGETEVRAARMAARFGSGVQYKIAYVSNLSDTAKTDIIMLPNPMTEEGGRILELRGTGIRYGFRRDDA